MHTAVDIFEGNHDSVTDIPVPDKENKRCQLFVQHYCVAMKTATNFLLTLNSYTLPQQFSQYY